MFEDKETRQILYKFCSSVKLVAKEETCESWRIYRNVTRNVFMVKLSLVSVNMSPKFNKTKI